MTTDRRLETNGTGAARFPIAQMGQLLLLASATWAATYARYATGPLQEAMHRSMSITDNRMAVLQGSAVAIPMVIGAIPVGLLADRISRKARLLVATALALIALVLSAKASGYDGLLLARFLALALTLIVIPGQLRALNVGVSLIVGSVFFIGLAPLAVSGLSGVLGGESALPQALAIVCASASLVNTVVLAWGVRYFPGKQFAGS